MPGLKPPPPPPKKKRYKVAPRDSFADRLAARFDDEGDFRSDPAGWAMTKADHVPTAAQRTIMESVREHRYTAVKSAHDLGKSVTAAAISAWWIGSNPVGTAFVVTTAPTAAQVSVAVWREIARMHQRANLRGRINRGGYPQWIIDGEQVGFGRKPSDYSESSLQGAHAEKMLVVIDEAGGVSKSLFEQVDTLVTNDGCRVLAIGNPDDPASHFSTLFRGNSGWNTVTLDGLKSPNFNATTLRKFPLTRALMEANNIAPSTETTAPEVRRSLLSPAWVEERITTWCGVPKTAAKTMPWPDLVLLVDKMCSASPIFLSKVRGVFPDDASTGVIPLGWVVAANNRYEDLIQSQPSLEGATSTSVAPPRVAVRTTNVYTEPVAPLRIAKAHTVGVDVARTGEDYTVLAHRLVGAGFDIVTKLESIKVGDTTRVADHAARYAGDEETTVAVDVIGVGAGVFDTLRRYRRAGRISARVKPFNAAANTNPRLRDTTGQFKFRNDRAAAWWALREALDPSKPGARLALPPNEALQQELTTVGYAVGSGASITVESKADIKSRLGRSTDLADAVVMALAASGTSRVKIDDATRKKFAFDFDPATGRARGAGRRPRTVTPWEGYEPVTADDFYGIDFGRVPGVVRGAGYDGPRSADPTAAPTDGGYAAWTDGEYTLGYGL